MPGPAPKNPAMRQRRNVASTRATVTATETPLPDLPPRSEVSRREEDTEWHPRVIEWWDDIRSDMSGAFVRPDYHSLLVAADLLHRFWRTGGKDLASEIRLWMKEYGLTAISRRTLQWETARAEEAVRKQAGAAPEPKTSTRKRDPRLRLVKSA